MHRNFWTGFMMIIILGFGLYCLAMWILGLLLKADIFDVLFGDFGSTRDKVIARSVGGGGIGLIIVLCGIYYFRVGGSISAVGADARATGMDKSNLIGGREQYILTGQRREQ